MSSLAARADAALIQSLSVRRSLVFEQRFAEDQPRPEQAEETQEVQAGTYVGVEEELTPAAKMRLVAAALESVARRLDSPLLSERGDPTNADSTLNRIRTQGRLSTTQRDADVSLV